MIQRTQINGITCDVYEADSRVDDIYAAAGAKMTIKELAVATGADVAGNLPYADYTVTGMPIGRNVVNGKQVSTDGPKTVARDSLFMLPDGTMHIGRPPAGVPWSLQGSPPLLEDGVDVVDDSIKRDQLGTDIWANNAKHLRIAYGLKSPYELVIVRTRAEITLKALAAVMKTLGCVNAINGDGGGSTTLYPADSGNGRKLGAALCIKEGKSMTNPFKLIGDDKPEVVIDIGHGGTDPGAGNSALGIIEKQINLQAGLLLRDRLKAHGVRVALTRDSDITLDPGPRAALVKNSGAKYCLSMHVNAGGGDGAEVIHSIHNDGKLANTIAAGIKAAGQNVRRVFCRAIEGKPTVDYYYMHRETGTVSTQIVELFFLDSKATGPDSDLNEYKAELNDWVEGVLCGYLNHTGRSYIPIVKPADPEPETPAVPGPFVDVPGDHWSASSVQWAKDIGLLAGKPDGAIGFGEPVTIERQAVMLHRLYQILKEVK